MKKLLLLALLLISGLCFAEGDNNVNNVGESADATCLAITDATSDKETSTATKISDTAPSSVKEN